MSAEKQKIRVLAGSCHRQRAKTNQNSRFFGLSAEIPKNTRQNQKTKHRRDAPNISSQDWLYWFIGLVRFCGGKLKTHTCSRLKLNTRHAAMPGSAKTERDATNSRKLVEKDKTNLALIR